MAHIQNLPWRATPPAPAAWRDGLPAPPAAARAGPLRVLCLHGITMNARSMGWMLARLKHDYAGAVEFVCVDAPHLLQAGHFGKTAADVAEGQAGAPMRTWSTNNEWHDPRGWVGDQASVDHVVAYVQHHGYFDGWLAFSQGTIHANRVLLHAMLCRPDDLELRALLPRFVVHVGGPQGDTFVKPSEDRNTVWACKPQNGFRIPSIKSLHVHGENDDYLNRHGRQGPRLYDEAQVLNWAGGHSIPGQEGEVDFTLAQARTFHTFLSQRYAEKNPNQTLPLAEGSAFGFSARELQEGAAAPAAAAAPAKAGEGASGQRCATF